MGGGSDGARALVHTVHPSRSSLLPAATFRGGAGPGCRRPAAQRHKEPGRETVAFAQGNCLLRAHRLRGLWSGGRLHKHSLSGPSAHTAPLCSPEVPGASDGLSSSVAIMPVLTVHTGKLTPRRGLTAQGRAAS